MRKTILAIGAGGALVLAGALAAPSAYAKGSATKYTGCLAKGDEAKEFKLTKVNGGTEEYELIGGKDLNDHVGHKVEIKGKLVSAKSAEKAEGEKGEKGEASHHHLKVTSMKHIAETCP